MDAYVHDSVEYIMYTDGYGNIKFYLTEDLARGEVRSVDSEEVFYSTSGDNSDWYYKGLDTYSDYHSEKSLRGTNEDDSLKDAGNDDVLVALRGKDFL